MSKKVKVILSVVVAVALLTVGGTATVMAQEEPVQEEPTPATEEGMKGRFLAKVTERLGITEDELLDIFKQAQQEMREDAFIAALERAVEKELITQPEADEILSWWNSRPEAVDRVLPCAPIFPALGGRHMMGIPGKGIGWGCISENVTDRIREWRGQRLGEDSNLFPSGRILQAMRGRHHFAGPGGWCQPAPVEPTE